MLLKIEFFGFIILLFAQFCSQNKCDTAEKVDPEQREQLQEGRTRRMIWLDKQRKLVFPPNTFISVTPILAFPMFKQSSNWIGFENIEIQWTFLSLGWTSPDNAWPVDVSLLFPNMTSDAPQNKRRNSGVDTCASPYPKRYNHFDPKCRTNNDPIPIMALPANSPGGDRVTLIPRLETVLNSIGINGRACLQRAVCEIHEIPLKHGFGLFGEFLTLIFSISRSTYAESHLQGYLKAERAGKFGDCSHFNRKCPYSLFTSKKT